MPYNWKSIWLAATEGRIEDIPPEIRIKYYEQIRRIAIDHGHNNKIIKYLSLCTLN